MQPRLVRVPMEGVTASLNDECVELVDISRRGVLVRLTAAPSLGSSGRLHIQAGRAVVAFSGRVVRVDRGEDPGVLVAMEFLSLSPAEVALLLRPLFAVLSARKPDDPAADGAN